MSQTPLDYSSQYAALYDLITGHKDYKAESGHLYELIKQHRKIGAPKAHLLSVGCGTGSHEIYLERAGLNVAGIDISAPMIRRAQAKPFERAVFTTSSIKEYALSHHAAFDIAISLFNVVNCLASIDELTEFIGSVAYTLKPKSLFFFECWNVLPCFLKPPEIVTRKFYDPNGGYNLVRTAVPTLEAATQKLRLDYTIAGVYLNKNVSLSSTHNLTLFTQIEIEYALNKAGFTHIFFKPALADRGRQNTIDKNTRMLGVHATRSAD